MDTTGSSIEGLDHARRPDRLYPILSHDWYAFYAGHLPDGRQLLAGVDGCRVVLGFFEPGGEFIDVERRTLPEGEEVEQYLSKEFGYRPSLVRVKRFRIPPEKGQVIDPLQLALVGESGFAIAPFPLDWQDFFNDPSSFCEEDRESYTKMIRGWVAREDFALYWGNEYFLNRDGEVVGS